MTKQCQTCRHYSEKERLDHRGQVVMHLGKPITCQTCTENWGPPETPLIGVVQNTCRLWAAKNEAPDELVEAK